MLELTILIMEPLWVCGKLKNCRRLKLTWLLLSCLPYKCLNLDSTQESGSPQWLMLRANKNNFLWEELQCQALFCDNWSTDLSVWSTNRLLPQWVACLSRQPYDENRDFGRTVPHTQSRWFQQEVLLITTQSLWSKFVASDDHGPLSFLIINRD